MDVVIEKKDRILIVAPHQDDETFGCGGLMTIYGSNCDVLLLSDGSLGNVENYKDKDELVRVRNAEFREACSRVGINNLFMLNLPNDKVKENSDKIYGFDIKPYKYIFLPNRKEDHPDHRACYRIFSKMKRRQHASCQIYEYEVWTPLTMPTWFLDISDVIGKKKEMIKVYQSQINDKDYFNSIIGLNAYRGMYNNYRYAEAYKLSSYNEFSAGLYNMLPESIKELVRKVISR